jgi:hypothetical protein
MADMAICSNQQLSVVYVCADNAVDLCTYVNIKVKQMIYLPPQRPERELQTADCSQVVFPKNSVTRFGRGLVGS